MNLEARVDVNTVVVLFDDPELATHSLLAELYVVVEGHVFEQEPAYR
jgi:hypothetical protein